jgi:hypothetical protein
MKKKIVFSALIFLACVWSVYAITYGFLDGDNHPNVGGLIGEVNGQKFVVCSGTLISRTVFLTAAHCTSYLESLGAKAYVSFDTHITLKSTFYSGTMHTNPGYNQAQSDPGDVAVVVLDKAVRGITPASLPSVGLFDRLKQQGVLQVSKFTVAGYGIQQRQVGGGQPFYPDDTYRRYAVESFDALNDAWLRLSQNPATGDGGGCYGDSGGPNFLGGGPDETSIIAAITITGDAVCRSTNVVYRMDSPVARAFLGQFVTLP